MYVDVNIDCKVFFIKVAVGFLCWNSREATLTHFVPQGILNSFICIELEDDIMTETKQRAIM